MAFSGLLNLGSTCYMNAVLQCLANSFEVRKALLSDIKASGTKDTPFSSMLHRLLHVMHAQTCTIRPATFLRFVLNDKSNSFANFEAQDAHEFLTYALDKVHQECSRPVHLRIRAASKQSESKECRAAMLYKQHHEQAYSTVMHATYGQIFTSLKSCETDFSSEVFETFSSLSLPIPVQGDVSLEQCLQAHFSEDVLDHQDKLYDDKNGKYVKAEKKHYLWKSPQILILSLARFGIRKNQTAVNISHELDLQKFMYPGHKQSAVYQLQAVIYHYGENTGGHYVAACRRKQDWFLFDDTVITKMPASEVSNANAYVLLYGKKSAAVGLP